MKLLESLPPKKSVNRNINNYLMKAKLLSLCAVLILVSCGTPKDATETKPNTDTDALLAYQEEITVPYLRSHLSVLAADSMEGRETGTRGQKMAAEYLAKQYRQMGLKPVGDNQSYYQKFNLTASKRDSTVFETFQISDGTKSLVERSVESYRETANYIRAFGGSDTLNGEIVYAGFGVNDPANNVAHLEGINLQGKWVLVFQEIPNVVDGDTLINPGIDARSRFGTIISQKGAEGLLLIPSMSIDEFQKAAAQTQSGYGKPSGMGLEYLNDGSGGGFSKGYTVINPALASQVLGLEQGAQGLENVRSKLVDNITAFSPRATGYVLKQTPYSSTVTVETENVLALLEGADPRLKKEVVVMTSHYDHVGIGQPDSTGDRIYNGADDDGSGTVALLNIAQALVEAKKNGVMPQRSILFLNVSGEEKGLLGSRYYSDHPVLPVDKTIANINTDMIGRIDPEHEKEGVEDYSYIIGGKIISSQLDSLLRVANNRSANIELSDRYNDLNDPNQFYRRSDHWNFARLGIPFIFFFTGVHEDYHRPSDEIEKIRFEKMAKVVKTMYATAVMVANAEKAPEVDNQEFIEKTKGN